MKWKANSALFLLPPVVFVGWTVFLYQFPPADIVDYMGAENAYLVTLVLSFLGGVSTLISVPYHLVLMTFAAGGQNPFLLGLVATIGQGAGDTTSYFLGYSGGNIAPQYLHKLMDGLLKWCTDRSYWQVALALFVYGSISPFSNDFILIPLGIARYPYRKVMLPLILGNLVFNTGAGLLGTYGLSTILAS